VDDATGARKGPQRPDERLAALPDALDGSTPALADSEISKEMADTERRRAQARARRAEREAKAVAEKAATAEAEVAVPERQAGKAAAPAPALVPKAAPTAPARDERLAPRMDSPTPLPPEVQRRLEQLWSTARMPVMLKLDMAVKYTASGAGELVREALPRWEEAARLIRVREGALAELTQELLAATPPAEVTAFRKTGLLRLHKELHSAVEPLRQLCAHLHRYFDETVTYDGTPYTERLQDEGMASTIAKIDRAMTAMRSIEVPE
jgi:hypothetical protein